jgi:hypothetical protein
MVVEHEHDEGLRLYILCIEGWAKINNLKGTYGFGISNIIIFHDDPSSFLAG